MGQKVNPHGLRVGVIKDWDSRWFADKKTFGATLVEDSSAAAHAILEYIDNTEHYAKHCQNAQQLARHTYNWNNIKDSFLQLIDEL